MMNLEEMKSYVAMDNTFVASETEEIKSFVETCKNLGIEVNEPVDEVEFNRLKDIIVAMYEDEMEEEEMNENNTAATEEEMVTAGEKAKEFMHKAAEKINKTGEVVVSHVKSVGDLAAKVDKMNNAEAQVFLANKGKDALKKIKDEAVEALGRLGILIETSPNEKGKANLINRKKSIEEFVVVIEETLSDDTKNGWNKFKTILKEVIKFVLSLIIKIASAVLKLGFTLAVGIVKIGATALVTTIELVKNANKDVVKPAVKSTKTAWGIHKFYKAQRMANKAAENIMEDFEDYEDELYFEDDNIVIE